MASPWLVSAAGAGQGLEQLLARQREDELMRQHVAAQAETVRSNQAREGFQQQQFAGQESDRALQRDALAKSREDTANNAMRDDVRTRESLRVPGSDVTPEEFGQVQKFGVLPMSSYSQAPGDFPANGDSGPPLPKIAFKGTNPQLVQQQQEKDKVTQQGIANTRADQTHADAVANQQATRDLAAETRRGTEAQRATSNGFQQQNIDLRRQALTDAEAKRKAAEGEVKLGEKGKTALRSFDTASEIIKPVLAEMLKQHPDIEDPNAPADMHGHHINQKYNTIPNLVQNKLDVLKYHAGMYDPQSPMIQLEKLLQPVQASQYMAGSRNQKMLDLVLEHLGNPGHTTAEQYSRLKTLMEMTPALKQAVVDAERPVKIDASGKMMGGGSDAGATPDAGSNAPAVGAVKTFPNGKRGRWDGTGWEQVQ